MRQKLVEVLNGVVLNPADDIGKIVKRINLVKFTGVNQAIEHGSDFGTSVAAGKEVILSANSNRSHLALDGVVVDLKIWVFDVTHQLDFLFP